MYHRHTVPLNSTFKKHLKITTDSAAALCSPVRGARMSEVSYRGVICNKAFSSLVPKVLAHTADSDGLIFRMDHALVVCNDFPDPPAGYSLDTPIGAVICREFQYLAMCEYTAKLSRAGVIRAVFLETQLECAMRWLDVHLLAKSRSALVLLLHTLPYVFLAGYFATEYQASPLRT